MACYLYFVGVCFYTNKLHGQLARLIGLVICGHLAGEWRLCVYRRASVVRSHILMEFALLRSQSCRSFVTRHLS